jgi:hypothetical protein
MLLELLATRTKGDKAARKAMVTGNRAVARNKQM